MKKLLIATFAAAAALAAPALVQAADVTVGPAASIQVPLSGTLAKNCNLSAFLNGPFDALNLESTAVQGAESLTLNCNYGGSASVTFASSNLGSLKSAGGQSVPYKLLLSGAGSPFSSGVSLATSQTWGGFPAVANANQTRSMSVQLDAPATVAGTYTDTITVSVQPN